MSDFELLIENYLDALRMGKLVAVNTGNWRGTVANAAWDAVLEPGSLELAEDLLTHSTPVLLFAEERQLVQHISAFDLADTEKLEAGEQLEMTGILGIADSWLGASLSAPIALVQDPILFALIKRLRSPLVGFRQVAPPGH
jgi:hypothetical protein